MKSFSQRGMWSEQRFYGLIISELTLLWLMQH